MIQSIDSNIDTLIKDFAVLQKALPKINKAFGKAILKEWRIESQGQMILGNSRGAVDSRFLTSRTGTLVKSLRGGAGAIEEVEINGDELTVTKGTEVTNKGFSYPFYHNEGKYPFLTDSRGDVEKLLGRIYEETWEAETAGMI